MNERIILDKLESEKNKYDLKGVELTLEDAENVIELINGGYDGERRNRPSAIQHKRGFERGF